ncbi:MAG: cobalt ECF transporter T component CbiQ [Planctomycetes bacterium]|nr:cobalt ECF transporter T component CbiQ [Planctomycetota bacterium]
MKGCFALFSDYFALRDNVLTRVDPRIKFVTAVGMIISLLLSTAFVWPLTVLCICMAAIRGMRVPLKIVIFRMIPPVMIVAVIVLLKTFFVSGGSLFEIDLGFTILKASRDGLLQGLLIGSKVTGAVSVILLLSFTTPAYKIFLSLLWLRVPNLWVETAMMMYRFIFSLIDNTANVISAQQTRLGYINMKKSLSSVGTLAGAVLLGAIDQSQRTTEAMMLRCYTGRFVTEPLAPLKKTDVLLILSLPVTAVVASFLIERCIG